MKVCRCKHAKRLAIYNNKDTSFGATSVYHFASLIHLFYDRTGAYDSSDFFSTYGKIRQTSPYTTTDCMLSYLWLSNTVQPLYNALSCVFHYRTHTATWASLYLIQIQGMKVVFSRPILQSTNTCKMA